jgi:carboxypeptidase family protein
VPRTSGLLVALLLCVGSPGIAAACECFGLPICATTWAADLVFVGTATKISEPSPGVEETEFVVEEWLRGERVEATITLRSEGIGLSCEYDFTQKVKYLVMAVRRAGVWKASGCGGTRPFPGAISDLNEIRDALRSRAPGTVSGEIFFDEFPDERVGGSVPIVGARVTLQAGRDRRSVTTDEHGAFRLARVPAGTYEIIVNVPSNATPVPSQHLVVGPNACIRQYFFSDPR